jgi:alpha-glucosidase (family GH31 glycosyl hydrolase)
MYTQFVRNFDSAHGFGSGTVMKPLWWNYPTEDSAYEHEDVEFLYGDDILVAPVLHQADQSGEVKLDVFLPQGSNWLEMQGANRYLKDTTVSYTL